MIINSIKIENYGSIDKIDISLDTNENGTPKPLVIVGKNGAGKTLLLSHLVDGMIEMKRSKYQEMLEVKKDTYFRVGSKSYIKTGKNHSLSKVTYLSEKNNATFTYMDVMANNPDVFIREFQGKEPLINYNDQKLKDNGFFKILNGNITDELEKNILLYFPAHRYIQPSWINEENQPLRFSMKRNFIGKSKKNIIKENVIKEIEEWVLNVVLDMHLYERTNDIVTINTDQGGVVQIPRLIQIDGRNTKLFQLLNQLLTIIYKFKFPDVEYARIGVSAKENRTVSVIVKTGGKEIDVVPSFSHFSSGEAMLLSLFGTLLKEYDEINSQGLVSLEDVKGIVIIDEIDLNLHIEFAKEILPNLILEFPNVQFIFTTHSPFVLLGMNERFSNRFQLINLPEGNEINIDDFSEVQNAYSTFIEGFQGMKNNYEALESHLSTITMPLIVTEGKTDWKHFKSALTRLQSNGEFLDVNIDFLTYEDSFNSSDSELYTLLKEISKINPTKKIIGIFDSDATYGKKMAKNRINVIGENVFGITIPTPSYRDNRVNGISVEFLYKNEDLLKPDQQGRRIYLSSEFDVNGRLIANPEIGVRNYEKVRKNLSEENSIIIDSDVIDLYGNSLALSKNQLAENVLTDQEPFNELDLEGFRELFLIIQEIVQGSLQRVN